MSIQTEIRSKSGKLIAVRLTPITAIGRWCQECSGWEKEYLQDCNDPFCPLYAFRSGKGEPKGKEAIRQVEEELRQKQEPLR